MNSGHTTERVYDTLKRRILGREFRPGVRLDPASLSEEMNSSVTPVRDALNLMTGEGLIDARPGEGFHLPLVDAPGLRDLYAWNAEILGLAARGVHPGTAVHELSEPIGAGAIADATAILFASIARYSPNIEHRRAIASANDRLHAARLAETKVLDGQAEELATIKHAFVGSTPTDLRRLLVAYHRRRQRAADDIVRTLYRNGFPR